MSCMVFFQLLWARVLMWLLMPLLILGMAPAFSATFSATGSMDKVVAVVNDEVITESQLALRLTVAEAQKKSRPEFQTMSKDAWQKQILQMLVQERLIRQFARNNGLMPTRNEVDNVVQMQSASFGKTPAAFMIELSRQGIHPRAFREQMELQIIVSAIRQQVLQPALKINQAEINAYLQAKALESGGKDSVEISVAHIVVKVADNASGEERTKAEEKVQKVLSAISDGAEFTDVAGKYSDFSDAKAGGVLGFRPIARLPDIYQEAVANMKKGEVSKVLKSANGYHILKVLDKREGLAQYVERIRASHILLRVEGKNAEAVAMREIQTLRKRLDAGENFAMLAERYSQDGSAKQGGDLGWLYPGDTVLEFEAALMKLKTGEISAPTRSPFGWHLIRLTARETVQLPEDKARQLATRVLSEEKIVVEFNRWLDDQTAKAYVNVVAP